MHISIGKSSKEKAADNLVVLTSKKNKLQEIGLSKAEIEFIKKQIDVETEIISINQYSRNIIVVALDSGSDNEMLEKCRRSGKKVAEKLGVLKISKVAILDHGIGGQQTLALTEGIALGSYSFVKYYKDAKKRTSSIKKVHIVSDKVTKTEVGELENLVEATCIARTLVNEPVSFLTSVQLAKEIQKQGKSAGFKVEIFNKKKIESLKMGGLLAVNKGSVDPPTFSVLEWKPSKSSNKKPIILVGKGIVYDTGGLSLKPTKGSMDEMKSDMGGAAAVIGAMCAVAKNKLPIHVIGLVPSTDNRPGGNAYAPGDVIQMHNGLHVEVLNTDAEGRMILADALSYARKYKPELVIDLATLTGSAVRAIGHLATCAMGTASEDEKSALKKSGNTVHERVFELPFWDEYAKMLDSNIADMKNIGGINAGAITAGKFLEHFTKDDKGNQAYPWIHLDIAGTAFLDFMDSYRGKGGTGVGVRLLYDFLKQKAI